MIFYTKFVDRRYNKSKWYYKVHKRFNNIRRKLLFKACSR